MNKYIRLDSESVVREIITEYSCIFPDIPVEERYSPDFLSACILVDESVEVKQNWDYLPGSNIFKEPIELLSDSYINANLNEEIAIEINFSTTGSMVASSTGINMNQENNQLVFTPTSPGIFAIKITLNADDARIFNCSILIEVTE